LEEALQWVEARELPQHPSAGEALAEEVALDLTAMPVLAKASAEEVAALQARMLLRSARAGKRLFKAGGDEASLYLVRSGSVQLSLAGHKKAQHELARVGLGGMFCSGAFLRGDAPALEAVALSDVEVYAISRADFDTLAHQQGTLATALLAEVGGQLAAQLAAAVEGLSATEST
jgi:SulP family sulfate permease